MKRRIMAYVLFAVGLGVYVLTMQPTVGLIDSGELCLAAWRLGIAHPTGYPLYTILGRLFSLLPYEPVLMTNFMSGFFSALSGTLIFLMITRAGYDKRRLVAGGLASLLFMFSQTVWQTAVVTEVYALETFLDILVVYLFLLGFERNSRLLTVAAIVAGLSFGNHMHTVLYVPSILLLMFSYRKRLSPAILLSMVIGFLVALSIYIYLPVRASLDPVVDWGNPRSWENFFRHVSGWQYRVWMFENDGQALGRNVRLFFRLFSGQVWIFMPFLLVVGLILCIVSRRYRVLAFFLLLCIVDFFYSINYSIPDIDAYYLPLIFGTVALFGIGLASVEKMWLFWAGATIGAIAVLAGVISNLSTCNESDDRFAEDMAYMMAAAAPNGALLLIDNWDFYAPLFYIQQARDFRHDIVPVDFALLKRSWYVEKLLRDYPEYFEPSRQYIERFVEEVRPFERRESHKPARIESAYREMIFFFVGFNMQAGHDVCSFVDWQPLTERFTARTNGLFDVYTAGNVNVLPGGLFDLPERSGLEERRSYIVEQVGRRMARGIMDLQTSGDMDLAITLAEALWKTEPENVNFIQNIGVLYVRAGQYNQAESWFRRLEGKIPSDRLQLIYNDLEKRKRADTIHQDERNGQ